MSDHTQTLEVAWDRRSGFPCMRVSGTANFVSVFPVTKLQVEQWIADGGLDLDAASDPRAITDLVARMELYNLPPYYADTGVGSVSRVPIPKCSHANLLSLLASNLRLWDSPQEIRPRNVKFPTPTSEWGRFVQWSEGRIPAYSDWRKTRDAGARLHTRDLLRRILEIKSEWPPTVECLLRRYLEITTDQEMGLPFMGLGMYELVSNTKVSERITVPQKERDMSVPLVAGDSRLWPTLEDPGPNKWHAVLHPHLPFVAVRLWYKDSEVVGPQIHSGFPTITLTLRSPDGRGKSPTKADSDRHSGLRLSSLSPVVRRTTMECRCPICYGVVPEKMFQDRIGLWCWKQITEADPNPRLHHSNKRPAPQEGMRDSEQVSNDYLSIARRDPSKVRSVSLCGESKTGKTCWMLSLIGQMIFPEGDAQFSRAFPEEWDFLTTRCSLSPYVVRAHSENVAWHLDHQIEEMWIVGDVPERNPIQRRALRCPVRFSITPRTGILGRDQRNTIVLLNDMPGELVKEAPDFTKMAEDGEYFSHLRATTDVIFLVPAYGISTATRILEAFEKNLTALPFEGRGLNIGEINLILAISQIDRLKHTTEDEEHLLDIFLREPFVWPGTRKRNDLADYVTAMRTVHVELEDWFRTNVPNLVTLARQFGSVRYCGFSALGFEPIDVARQPAKEGFLPFDPHPVRVADPLLWLLVNHGWLSLRNDLGVAD